LFTPSELSAIVMVSLKRMSFSIRSEAR
jgi:hypothetical protein